MSCFIVEESTINRIVSFIEQSNMGGDYERKEICSPVTALWVHHEDKDTYENLAMLMDEMNKSAYSQRYGEEQGTEEFCYKFQPFSGIVQVYKSLQCYIYQCSEGDQPDRPLYKAFRAMQDNLARYIVQSSAVYEAAEWN